MSGLAGGGPAGGGGVGPGGRYTPHGFVAGVCGLAGALGVTLGLLLVIVVASATGGLTSLGWGGAFALVGTGPVLAVVAYLVVAPRVTAPIRPWIGIATMIAGALLMTVVGYLALILLLAYLGDLGIAVYLVLVATAMAGVGRLAVGLAAR